MSVCVGMCLMATLPSWPSPNN